MQYKLVLDLARQQFDVISLESVLEIASKRTLHRWLRQRMLFPMAPRVYSPIENPVWRARVHAGTLVHTSLVASHGTAARIWGMSPVAANKLEFLAPVDNGRVIPGADVRESNFLPSHHIVWKDGTRVTVPIRSLIDSSARWNKTTLESALIKGLDKRLFTVAGVARMREEMARRGRRRTTFVDAVLDGRHADDPKLRSELERKAKRLIVAAGLPTPVGAHPIPLDHITLHPDLAFPERHIAVELDGFETHHTIEAFHEDRRRDASITQEGWHVVRFSWRTLDKMIPTLRSLLKQAA